MDVHGVLGRWGGDTGMAQVCPVPLERPVLAALEHSPPRSWVLSATLGSREECAQTNGERPDIRELWCVCVCVVLDLNSGLTPGATAPALFL
jgi:hypothetical protein